MLSDLWDNAWNKKKCLEDDSKEAIERKSEDTQKTTEIDIYNGSGGHINFFKDAEDGVMIGITREQNYNI
jgi:hypothetical protein